MWRRQYHYRLVLILFCIIFIICSSLFVYVFELSIFASKNGTMISTNDISIRKMNLSEKPKEAFVTFTNKKYLKLLKVLLDSIHIFSSRPIIVYAVDVNIDIDCNQYPHVIIRNISQADCGSFAYYCKLHAIISSDLDYGVLLEADDIVNYNIDILFDLLHVWPYSFPLSPRHPGDPADYVSFMKRYNVTRRTTPYIHAHIIWTFRALPFLRSAQSLLREGGFHKANYDETAINVMLWKVKANHTLCTYDPYHAAIKIYEHWPLTTNCFENCHAVFLTLHGCKDPNLSARILTKLKANMGKPVVQTFGKGGMKHINDTNATCCYPDSQPSPIHPLLCEHKMLD